MWLLRTSSETRTKELNFILINLVLIFITICDYWLLHGTVLTKLGAMENEGGSVVRYEYKFSGYILHVFIYLFFYNVNHIFLLL